MKISKVSFSSLITASILVGTGCSNNVTNIAQNTSSPKVEQKASNTESLAMTEQEINEINNLLAQENLNDKSFNIKDATQGSDASVDLLLMNPKAAGRAHFWGIKTVEKLLNAGSSPRKRWFLERKLGGLFPSDAFKVQVLFWVERADLMRVNNVSIDDSFLLVMSGITSAPHLARFNNIIDQASLKVQLSLLAFQYGMPIPSLDEIKNWTNDATKLAPVIY